MTGMTVEKRELSAHEKRELLERLLKQRTERAPSEHPLSLIQEPLWFLDKLLQGRPVYHLHAGFRITGKLDGDIFERALDEIVRRHEVMRTILPAVDGRPFQRVLPYERYRLPREDLSALALPEREEEVRKRCAREAHAPIDLEAGPLWRARLFRLDEGDHLLYLKMHHIISDGWSLSLLMQELFTLYKSFCEGAPPSLPALPAQYRDYVLWQRSRLTGARLEELIAYWRGKLAPPLAALELPLKGPRPPLQSHRGGHLRAYLPLELIDRARDVCRTERTTLFMMLLSVYKLLLFNYSRQTDITVGAPVANRLRPEFEPLIGYFASMTVMRTSLDGDPTFRELMQRVRQTVTEAFKYQELPLETLVKELRPERDPSRHPLFQAMFVLQAGRNQMSREIPGLKFAPLKSGTGSSKFDLQLIGVRRAEHFRLSLGYNSDLLDAEFAARILAHYRNALEAAIENPDMPISTVPLMDKTETERMLGLGLGEKLDLPEGIECAHHWIEHRAAENPDALAMESGDRRVSYAELNGRANSFARRLSELGVGAEDRVAVLLDRSPVFVAAILAVLKSGGAYVPLDPQQPPKRLSEIIAQCGARVVITSAALSAALPPLSPAVPRVVVGALEEFGFEPSNPPAVAHQRSLAYVIYTSGSTGKPKGVMIEHRSLINYIHAAIHAYRLLPSDRVLQFASLGFDAHVEEIFPALCVGATVVPRTDAMLDSFPGFLLACSRAGITVLSLPTAYWHELVATMEELGLELPESLRLMIIGGERALSERVASWVRRVGRGVRLLNTYGPTEATVIATCHEARESTDEDILLPVPIGRPIANMGVRVLDDHMRPVPLCVSGELFLGGEGLARGYLDDPALSAQRFIADPFSAGARLYRTGDLARWRPDGELEFLGRADAQVKLRGFRIEPEEVEAVLNEHPDVTHAAVVVIPDQAGAIRLVAGIVSRGEVQPTVAELRDFITERLPKFMVPSAFVTLAKMPFTVNGKIDRRAVEKEVANLARDIVSAEYEAPATETESRLAQVFCELLGVARVGRHDNFFELGGHSLLALRLMTRLQSDFGTELPLVTLFSRPTVAELAAAVDAGRLQVAEPDAVPHELALAVDALFAAGGSSPLVPLAVDDDTRRPIFLVHGLGGHVAIFADLARRLGDRLAVYGLRATGTDSGTVSQSDLRAMAAEYVAAIRGRQPSGPYRLGGWSMGGMLALEMAQQLNSKGETVELLAMFDTHLPRSQERALEVDDDAALKWICARIGVPPQALLILPRKARWRAVLQRGREARILPPDVDEQQIEQVALTCRLHVAALARYQPAPYHGDVLLFRAQKPAAKRARRTTRAGHDDPDRWRTLFEKLQESPVKGSHYSIMREPNVGAIEAVLVERLQLLGAVR
jgi:amino acid adenylation domain-containing protein